MRGEKWAQATKDLCWEESWDEEFAPEHKRRCVGISSKRISHLIKASAQLPGGLYATPSSFMQTSHCCRTYENQCKCRAWGGGGSCLFLWESKPAITCSLLMTLCHAESRHTSRFPSEPFSSTSMLTQRSVIGLCRAYFSQIHYFNLLRLKENILCKIKPCTGTQN